MAEPMSERVAVAEILAQELDIDMAPAVLAAADKFLMLLWVRGFKVTSLSGHDKNAGV